MHSDRLKLLKPLTMKGGGVFVALVMVTGVINYGGTASPKAPESLALSIQKLGPPVRKGLAKYEPKSGCYLGAYINFDPTLNSPYRDIAGRIHQLPGPFEEAVGKPHAMYFFYMGYGSRLPVDWLEKLADSNRFVHIALEPNNGLDYVKNDDYLRALATKLRRSNAKVFLRFASEMNGPWTKYHGDPAKYREKFRLVYKVMRDLAPNVAMVWCPFQTPIKYIDSYYPGDDAVDWVGVNVYSVTYHDNDPKRPACHEDPVKMMDYVYRKYASRKPMMIGEYGATNFSSMEKKDRADFAKQKILRMYNAMPHRPRVKAINYFHSNNIAFVKHRQNNDYSVTSHPKVLTAYQKAIAKEHFIGKPDPKTTEQQLKPVSDGEPISGWFRIYADSISVSDAAHITFKLDGRILRVVAAGTGGYAELNAKLLPKGPHLVEVEGKTVDGELVGYARFEFVAK